MSGISAALTKCRKGLGYVAQPRSLVRAATMDVTCVGCGMPEVTGHTLQACLNCEKHLCDWCKPSTMGSTAVGPATRNPALGLCSDACFRGARPRAWGLENRQPPLGDGWWTSGTSLDAVRRFDNPKRALVVNDDSDDGEMPLFVVVAGEPIVPWWYIVAHLIRAGK